jgi:hypothetical protein
MKIRFWCKQQKQSARDALYLLVDVTVRVLPDSGFF